MKKAKKISQKRIPTIFALIILFASIWVTLLLIRGSVNIIGKASPDLVPQNITTTNINDSSFTVVFTTSEKSIAVINLDDNNESKLFFDDREIDTHGEKEFYSHSITVNNLKPKTGYSFYIMLNGSAYFNKGNKFTVTTGPTLKVSAENLLPIKGKVILSNGDPAKDTIIKISSEQIQEVSTITKESGEYEIPINSIRTKTLDSHAQLNDDAKITLTALRQYLQSTINVVYKNANNIPLISLSQNYNFDATQSTKVNELRMESQLNIPTITTKKGEVKILVPKKDESFIDSRPLFSGTAIPLGKVKITIQSDIITAEITANKNGAWSFRPSVGLPAGEHTITIETLDANGITRIITENFFVFGSGSQIIESATPSATPIILPTEIPTVIPTLEPTQVPTSVPTIAPTTIEPTSTPIPTTAVNPTNAPTTKPVTTIAPAGSNTSSTILTFVSVIFIFTGATLLFLL